MNGRFEVDGRPQGVNGVGVRVSLVQLGSRKWTNLDSGWTNYRKPETCLHHNISDQDRTAFWADRWQDEERWTQCLEHRCSALTHTQSWWKVFTHHIIIIILLLLCWTTLKISCNIQPGRFSVDPNCIHHSPSPNDAFCDLWGSASSVSRHFTRNQRWTQILRPREVGTQILQYFLPKSEIWSAILSDLIWSYLVTWRIHRSSPEPLKLLADSGRNEWMNEWMNK